MGVGVTAVPGVQIALQPGINKGFRSNAYLDLSRISEKTDYKLKFTLETGMADYVAWLKAGNTF